MDSDISTTAADKGSTPTAEGKEIKATNDDMYTEHEKAVYRRVFKTLHTAAEDLQGDEKQKCTDICCRTCVSCECCKKCHVEAHNLSSVLLRGRATGWAIHREIVLPLMKDTTREILVFLEILTAFTALGLSAATYHEGKREAFNIVHLALTITATVLALVDGVFSLRCKICRVYCCCQDENEIGGDTDKGEGTSYTVRSGTEVEAEGSSNKEPGACRKCLSATKSKLVTKNSLDVVRIILTEAILYPLLICDLFELITGGPYQWKDKVQDCSFVRFVLTAVSMVCFVYIMRLAILGRALYYTQKTRKPKKTKDETPDFDYSISNWSRFFQGYFFYHVLMQMIVQILMIVVIGVKIKYDDIFQSSDTNDMNKDGVHVHYYLWYMLVGGFLFPVFGYFTFFIGTYYWVQQFQIGLCIDMLSMLQISGMNKIMNFKESTEEYDSKMKKIIYHVKFDKLKKEFNDLWKQKCCKSCVNCCQKFMYPFMSPALVILSFSYFMLQLAFAIFAGFVSENGFVDVSSLKGGPWVWMCVASVGVWVVANMSVVAVIFFWTAVVSFVSAVVVLAVVIVMSILAIVSAVTVLLCAAIIACVCFAVASDKN